MELETVRMSSKGQIVIPQAMREELHADEGTLFMAMRNGDTIILKKIETPSKEELIKRLHSMAKEGRARLEARGVKEEDIPGIVERSRRR